MLLLHTVNDVQQLLEQAHIQHHLDLYEDNGVKSSSTQLHTCMDTSAVYRNSLSCFVHTRTHTHAHTHARMHARTHARTHIHTLVLCHTTCVALHAGCLAYLLQEVSPPDQPWLAVAGPQVHGLQNCKLAQRCCLACLTFWSG